MIEPATEIGINRTGIATGASKAKEMEEEVRRRLVEEPSRGEEIGLVRVHYAHEGLSIGSLTPPTTLRGAAKTAIEALKGNRPTTLFDQLGARLAFERAGTRLYDAVISKLDAYGSWDGGPSREDLQLIADDELVHFHTVRWAIQRLGGDPTMVTPAADVADLSASGIRQILADPRTDLFQCLTAMLSAELTDNDAWTLLIALVQPVDPEIAERFEEALAEEHRHLTELRTWILAGVGLELADLAERLSPSLEQTLIPPIEPAQP